jgi:hypothetical protein
MSCASSCESSQDEQRCDQLPPKPRLRCFPRLASRQPPSNRPANHLRLICPPTGAGSLSPRRIVYWQADLTARSRGKPCELILKSQNSRANSRTNAGSPRVRWGYGRGHGANRPRNIAVAGVCDALQRVGQVEQERVPVPHRQWAGRLKDSGELGVGQFDRPGFFRGVAIFRQQITELDKSAPGRGAAEALLALEVDRRQFSRDFAVISNARAARCTL